ncbi:MAG: ATP-dependent DNA helicase UvrD2 [Austwickia sp.]|nr:ATP-dependent DNA helicase UvrD2 [Austwickia sp.]MBK8435953.1 ATP-dependent DNA helicase UvrD2 [Austwickia sp.]
MDPDALLEGLDPEQRQVACAPVGAMCVLAGAGTGKTRAITHRIAYGVHCGAYQPGHTLAVTFTARAAGQMRTRLRDLGVQGVQARTFHAAALRQLQYFWPRAIGGGVPPIAPQTTSLVAEAAGRLRLRVDRAVLRDLGDELRWTKVSGLTAQTYVGAAGAAHRSVAAFDPITVARFIETYEEVKTERGVIDFEDVLLITVGILAERDDIAETVRAQYRQFVVDEYQDVNVIQQRLLDLWLGDRRDICVVGDPAQTIYTFAGATPDHLLGFAQRHPDAQVVRLVRNYRSTPQIVAVANAVVAATSTRSGTAAGAAERPDGSSRSARLAVSSGGLRLLAQRANGPSPRVSTYPDDEAEAHGIAADVAAAIAAGCPAEEIAVLYRVNAQSGLLEHALAERGVSYLLHGGERFFNRPEIRSALVMLRGAARSDDGSTPLPELTRDVLVGTGWSPHRPSGSGAVREQWESINALADLAQNLAASDPQARLPDLVRELDERAASQHAPTVAGVTLASLHAAKGLEWDIVFLAGCSDGLLPLAMAQGAAAVDEERRLAYVGITRARRELRISWATARSAGGRATRKPSRFILPAARLLGDADLVAHAASRGAAAPGRGKATARPARAPARCRSCAGPLTTTAERKVGRCTNCPPTYDEATFEALRAWRRDQAAKASVPAYVVFTDATLTAIAERRPRSSAELAQVPGVGPTKLASYGPAVLDLLAQGGTVS